MNRSIMATWLFLAGALVAAQTMPPAMMGHSAADAASGGGVTVGDAVSGGTASRLLFSDGSTLVSTATPVAVTSSLDLTSGTLDVGGACTLDSTLRVDSTADIRGAISNGGSGTCNSLVAGSACINDSAGTVITTGGTAAVSPLTVQVPAVSAAIDPGFTVLYGESANAWANVLSNGTSTAGQVVPVVQTRHIGSATTNAALILTGGLDSSADSTSATVPVVAIDGRREAGTPASPSGSAITSKPIFGVRNSGTGLFSINVNGGLGLRTISPTALSGAVNDYAGCTTTPICRINGGAADRDVTGIVPGYNSAWDSSQSELFFVCNIGTTNNLVLKHENAGSSAANRFTFNATTDRNVLPRSCRTLIYDRTSQLWRSATGD